MKYIGRAMHVIQSVSLSFFRRVRKIAKSGY